MRHPRRDRGRETKILPGVVKIPDVSFISWARFPNERVPRRPIPKLIPDLVVEIKSPDDSLRKMREKAASALRITAPDLFELKVVDEIIPEPKGGAHADHQVTAVAVHDVVCRHLDELRKYKPDKLVRRRREKFLRMGQFLE